MAHTLRLAPALRGELEAWARAGYPHECCGLLLGRQAEAATEVAAVRRAANRATARAKDRFELDPADYLAIDREAQALGLEIVGVWHTHPDHPARPSPTDLAAAWPRLSYVILGVGRGGVEALTSWRLASEAFEEEVIEP